MHKDKASYISIGTSFEGRDLFVMKIGMPDPRGVQKPVIWIDGGIHAREWISPASVMYIIHELLEKSGHHLTMLKKYDFYIMPMMNPDGYEYTHTADREAFQYGGILNSLKVFLFSGTEVT